VRPRLAADARDTPAHIHRRLLVLDDSAASGVPPSSGLPGASTIRPRRTPLRDAQHITDTSCQGPRRDLRHVIEQHAADRISPEIDHDRLRAALELKPLIEARVGKSCDDRRAVARLPDAPDVL